MCWRRFSTVALLGVSLLFSLGCCTCPLRHGCGYRRCLCGHPCASCGSCGPCGGSCADCSTSGYPAGALPVPPMYGPPPLAPTPMPGPTSMSMPLTRQGIPMGSIGPN
jgi:hypothetical protein